MGIDRCDDRLQGISDPSDAVAEHLLRIIQSFVIDPGRPPRRGVELRNYLRRWVGTTLLR